MKKQLKDIRQIEIDIECDKHCPCKNCPYYTNGTVYYCEVRSEIDRHKKIIEEEYEIIARLEQMLEIEIEVNDNE